MKRVAGAHLPTPWLFEPAKRLDDVVEAVLIIGKHAVFLMDYFVSSMFSYHIFR